MSDVGTKSDFLEFTLPARLLLAVNRAFSSDFEESACGGEAGLWYDYFHGTAQQYLLR